MRKISIIGLSVAIAATGMLLISPGADRAGSQAQAQAPKLVKISAARGIHHLSVWGVAPFAAKYGLQTEVIATNTNAEMQRYAQTGEVQIATLGYQTPAIMAEQGVTTIKVIAGHYNAGQNLIMRKGVKFDSWKDLEGKKIGVPPGTYVGVLFLLAAKTNNVDISKVNIVNITPVGTVELQALKSGDLDGLVMWSPVIDRGVVDGYAVYPACCDIGSTAKFGAGNQILGANVEFLKDRTAAVNLLKALIEAKEFYTKNPEKALEVITQYAGIDKAVLTEALKRANWETRVDIEIAKNVAKEGPVFGFTRADMSGKVEPYFDLSYLSEATGKNVDQLRRFTP
jgi:sulfonate transport system substrate-binding protein